MPVNLIRRMRPVRASLLALVGILFVSTVHLFIVLHMWINKEPSVTTCDCHCYFRDKNSITIKDLFYSYPGV